MYTVEVSFRSCYYLKTAILTYLNIDWTIPNTTYNDCHTSFTKFCSDNILTQLIDSPTHKDGKILDLLLCNYLGLDRIKFH